MFFMSYLDKGVCSVSECTVHLKDMRFPLPCPWLSVSGPIIPHVTCHPLWPVGTDCPIHAAVNVRDTNIHQIVKGLANVMSYCWVTVKHWDATLGMNNYVHRITWNLIAHSCLDLQGSPFPTARRPGASKTASGASGFEQIFPLYFI